MNYSSNSTICQCANCGAAFDVSELKIRKRKLYNKEIEEKTCPFCNGIGYTMIKDIKWFSQRYIEQPKIYKED